MKILVNRDGQVFGPFNDIAAGPVHIIADGTCWSADAITLAEIDGEPLDFAAMDYLYVDGQLQPKPQPAPAATVIEEFLKRVDADADAIIAARIGNKAVEYQAAYADAKAYSSAGYEGAVPQSVQDWADIKRQTPRWAADDVVATGDAWAQASAAIRKHRLASKEAGRLAVTHHELDAAEAAWEQFKSFIKYQLGI